MKHSIIKKRTASITGFSSIFFCSIVNAQIVYTDIPDVTLDCRIHSKNSYCSKSYSLDLNNDGTADFTINAEAYSYNDGRSVCYNKCSDYENRVFVSPLNENATYADTLNSSWPLPFRTGDIIGASLTWNGNTLGTLHDTIHYCWYWGQCTNWSFALGKWITENDRYLGARLIVNNQPYYGWIRVAIAVSPKQVVCKIMDYAFMNTPDKVIHAGDTGAPLAKSSVGNTSKLDAGSLNLKIVPNPAASTTTISFSLGKAENVSIKIFDMNGRLINTIAETTFTAGQHQLHWNAANVHAGIYVIRLDAGNQSEVKKLAVVK